MTWRIRLWRNRPCTLCTHLAVRQRTSQQRECHRDDSGSKEAPTGNLTHPSNYNYFFLEKTSVLWALSDRVGSYRRLGFGATRAYVPVPDLISSITNLFSLFGI